VREASQHDRPCTIIINAKLLGEIFIWGVRYLRIKKVRETGFDWYWSTVSAAFILSRNLRTQ
jgi:hypothetical protein